MAKVTNAGLRLESDTTGLNVKGNLYLYLSQIKLAMTMASSWERGMKRGALLDKAAPNAISQKDCTAMLACLL